MCKNSISAGLVSKLHLKMTMMAVDESSDLMGEVAEVAYHLSLHNCRGVVTSLLHLGLFLHFISRKAEHQFPVLRIRDPRSGAFLTWDPRSVIGFSGSLILDLGSRIPNPKPIFLRAQ
jgi:hypothetical protein